LAVAVDLCASTAVLAKPKSPNIKKIAIKAPAPIPAPIPSLGELDQWAAEFESRTSSIRLAPDCFPVHVAQRDQVGIWYLYCSKEAYTQDGLGQSVSETFSVQPELARRFNFWRRVYSLWSKEQYVLHITPYPEVVLEMADVSHVVGKGEIARLKLAERILNQHKQDYRRLFQALHKHRHRPFSELSPALRRVAEQMAHITDPDKYQRAASSMRVQRGQRDFVGSGLRFSGRYMKYVQDEFDAVGIPRELAYLSFVESSFNLEAHSRVGASGVFQIMPDTGRQYLRVTEEIDERDDPIKASKAAAKLLRMNYEMTGDWALAITAYNHGVGGVRDAVKKTKSNDIAHLIKFHKSKAFRFASQNFYTEYLGMLATLQDSKRVFPEIQQAMALQFVNIRMKAPMSMSEVKRKYRMTAEEIHIYNPDISRLFIKRNGSLHKGYVLKVPAISDPQQRLAVLSAFQPQ